MLYKKVAIYGGAFDPPTLAHVHIAEKLTELVDEVWIMPVFKHRIKRSFLGPKSIYQQYHSSYEHRVTMCDIAFGHIEKCKVRSLERAYCKLNDEYYGATNELLNYLRVDYPNINFVLAIGQDNAETINKWKNYQSLINSTSFIVYARGNDTKHVIPSQLQGNTFIKTNKYLDVSSTQARNLFDLVLQTNRFTEIDLEKAKTLLPQKIINYIVSTLG